MAVDQEILAQLSALVGRRDLTIHEIQNWWAGEAAGGPSGDGMFPATDSTGFQRMLPSPAKVAAAALLGASGVFVFPDEFDHLAGTGSAHDDLPAFKAMFASALATGRVPAGRPAVRYYLSDTLEIDPSRTQFEGNACILDFRAKTFYDQANLPELLSDYSMDTGQGWYQSQYATFQPLYNGFMDAESNWPNDGNQRYVELGQQIICKAGDKLQISIEFEDIATRTVGVNTFRTLTMSLRRPTGTPAQALGSGANVGAVGTASNSDTDYAVGYTKSYIAMPTADNPYLRIQANCAFRIRSISVKIIPMNACVLMRVQADGQLRGHNYRNFRNFKIAGKSAQANFVDGILFDTLVAGFASRTNFYNVDISDGIGRCLVFGNRTYLNNFYSCRFVAAIACVETLDNSADAGENISFFGGNLGGGNIGIRNLANFAIRLFGTSIDFSRQWIVGGAVKMFGGWLETNVPNPWNGPLIDVVSSDVMLFNTRVQVDGSAVTLPGAPFRVAGGSLLHIEAEGPYNLTGPNGELCEGEGRFYFRGIGGRQKEIASITKRDDDHNILGVAGSFEGDSIAIPAWLVAGAGSRQVTRHKLTYAPITTTVTGDVVRGSSIISNLSVAPTVSTFEGRKVLNPEAGLDNWIGKVHANNVFTASTTAGSNILTGVSPAPTLSSVGNKRLWGPGIPAGAKVLAYSNANGTVTMDSQATATATGVTISPGRMFELTSGWQGPDTVGMPLQLLSNDQSRAEMSVSTDTARTGTRSLKIQKIGVGSGTALRARIAIPVEKFRAFGAEWHYRVLPGSVTGFTSGTASVYFQTMFVQLTDQGGLIPLEGPTSDFISDIPVTGIDLVAGRDWTRLSTATNRRDGTAGHIGYTPEWATHMMITIELSSTPNGFALYIDDVHGNMM